MPARKVLSTLFFLACVPGIVAQTTRPAARTPFYEEADYEAARKLHLAAMSDALQGQPAAAADKFEKASAMLVSFAKSHPADSPDILAFAAEARVRAAAAKAQLHQADAARSEFREALAVQHGMAMRLMAPGKDSYNRFRAFKEYLPSAFKYVDFDISQKGYAAALETLDGLSADIRYYVSQVPAGDRTNEMPKAEAWPVRTARVRILGLQAKADAAHAEATPLIAELRDAIKSDPNSAIPEKASGTTVRAFGYLAEALLYDARATHNDEELREGGRLAQNYWAIMEESSKSHIDEIRNSLGR